MKTTNRQKYWLNMASYYLVDAMEALTAAEDSIVCAFDGDEPGYAVADSPDARGWDYLDAIAEAQRAIGIRLNTWDEGEYDE